MCGKGLYTIAEANALVKDSRTLRRFYRCELAPFNRAECYHVTKSRKQGNKHAYGSRHFQFHPQRVLRELNKDMTLSRALREAIIELMEDSYKKFGNYKHTPDSLSAVLIKRKATWTKRNVASEISTMKKAGLVVPLDKVPNAKGGASYVGLVSILDRVTEPAVNASTKPVISKPKPSDIKPAAKPIIPAQTTKEVAAVTTLKTPVVTPATAANPFDKVNTKLDQIAAAVQGLAQGYSEMATKPTPPVDTNQIIDALKLELGEMGQVYLKEFKVGLNESNQSIFKQVNDLMLSVDGSEDYKRGVKDGITLAIEMGLAVNK